MEPTGLGADTISTMPDRRDPDDLRELDTRSVVEILLRRWRFVVGCTVMALLAGWFVASRRADTYTAGLVLRIRTPRSGAEALGLPAILSDRPELATSELEALRSASVLGKVVDSLGLQLVPLEGWTANQSSPIDGAQVAADVEPGRYVLELSARGVQLLDSARRAIGPGAGPGEWMQAPGFRILIGPRIQEGDYRFAIVDRLAATEALRASLKSSQVRSTSLIRLGYTAEHPRKAAAVLNAVAQAYTAHSVELARQESRRRREFIAVQLVALSDSLRSAQAALQSQQEESQSLDPQVQSQVLTQALVAAGNDLRLARFRQGVLADILRSLQSDSMASEGMERMGVLSQDVMPSGAAEYGHLRDLLVERRRLTGSRFGFTAQGPEVEVLDSLIALTRRDVRAAAEQALQLSLQAQQSAEAHVAELTGQIARLPGQAAVYSRLRQRVEAVQRIYDVLLAQFYQEQISEASEAGSAEIVDPAYPPSRPDGQQRRVPLFAALAGLFVGVAGAVAREHFSAGIRHTADAERASGVPAVGEIPRLAELRRVVSGTSGNAGRVDDPVGGEAFSILRTNLRFVRTEHPRVIEVTSCEPGEGKSTVALCLAASYARQGSRVLLVDADLRRPVVHRTLRHPRAPGLTDVLVGSATLADVVVPGAPGAPDALTCGTRAVNPAELLGSQAFATVIKNALESHDFVIVDTPPALAVADPALVAEAADGILVVVQANRTSRFVLQRVVESLQRGRTPVLGVVLNLVPTGGVYGRYRYSYRHYSHYHDRDSDHGEDNEGGAVSRLVSRIRALVS